MNNSELVLDNVKKIIIIIMWWFLVFTSEPKGLLKGLKYVAVKVLYIDTDNIMYCIMTVSCHRHHRSYQKAVRTTIPMMRRLAQDQANSTLPDLSYPNPLSGPKAHVCMYIFSSLPLGLLCLNPYNYSIAKVSILSVAQISVFILLKV